MSFLKRLRFAYSCFISILKLENFEITNHENYYVKAFTGEDEHEHIHDENCKWEAYVIAETVFGRKYIKKDKK